MFTAILGIPERFFTDADAKSYRFKINSKSYKVSQPQANHWIPQQQAKNLPWPRHPIGICGSVQVKVTCLQHTCDKMQETCSGNIIPYSRSGLISLIQSPQASPQIASALSNVTYIAVPKHICCELVSCVVYSSLICYLAHMKTDYQPPCSLLSRLCQQEIPNRKLLPLRHPSFFQLLEAQISHD